MKRLSSEQEKKAMEMYQAGLPLADIASAVGFRSIKSVNDVRKRLSVPKRSRFGELSSAWKGGRSIAPSGYVYVWVDPEDPVGCAMVKDRARHRVREHRLLMAHSLGRPLTANETVHHINGNRADNRLENLELRHGNHGTGTKLRCRKCGCDDIEAVQIEEAR